ncbi:carboxypeptidase-like regulatory domain-containing protein [candidate division KSB1 bacterium]
MKNVLILMILILLPFGLLSQNFGSIYGRILDEESKESLPGANIWVETGGSLVGTTTDNNGYFKLKPLRPGIYNVNISFVGYETAIMKTVRVNPDKITFLNDVSIVKIGIMSPEFEKKAKPYGNKLIDPLQPSMQSLSDRDLKNIPGGKNVANLISSFSSDIKVDAGDRIYIRGARNGSVLYLVDGIRMKDPNIGIPTSAISSMTVYTGAVPAKYGDFTGGVIVIETKSYFDFESERIARNL